ncbi:AAA-like domain-containing protein [Nostoc sp. FACHB-888]|nr:AAA-like domain-containing protein [Nostoc sp. FACHB-888]
MITYKGDRILPRCELYRAYFKTQLGVAEFEYKSLRKRA